MRDKHINMSSDSLLLKRIHAEVLKDLSGRKINITAMLIFKFCLYFSIWVFLYWCILGSMSSGALMVHYILFGLTSVLLGFNFAHDFSHNTVFKNKSLNNLCFIVLYTFVGAHAEAWKYRHIHSHHYAPNVKDYDSDLQITSLMRVEPTSEHKWYHRYQHYYAPLLYTTYSLYWVLIKDFLIYFTDKTNPAGRTTRYHLSFWSQKLFYFIYLLLIPLLFTSLPWHIVIISFLAMHLVQSQFLLFTFFITHHVEKTAYFDVDEAGYINTSWMNNQVKSSNDFYPFSETANFIFGGFNNHVAHHLFPHIHHIYYPFINKIIYRILRENKVEPNVSGFFSGIRSHLRHLKNMSVKKCNGDCRNCAVGKAGSTPVSVSSFHKE